VSAELLAVLVPWLRLLVLFLATVTVVVSLREIRRLQIQVTTERARNAELIGQRQYAADMAEAREVWYSGMITMLLEHSGDPDHDTAAAVDEYFRSPARLIRNGRKVAVMGLPEEDA
jgi:hypothetical protein